VKINSVKQTMNIRIKKIIIYSLLIIIFFLGIWTERFGVDKKILNKFNNLIDSSSQLILSFKNNEKIYIEIKPKHYNEIIKNRKTSLEKGRAPENIQKWLPAKLKYKDVSYNIQISLKGTHSDHWIDTKKWSYKIKVNDNEKSILGLRRFAVQAPYTISYVYEWLFMKALSNEKLFNLKITSIETQVNEKNLGAYILEEKISYKLLERNNKKPGPIIGFSKTLWVEEANNIKDLGVNGIDESFWRAKIEPTQFDKNLIGTEQEKLLKKAIYQLESFRKKELTTSEVFDTKQLAKVMAIRAIMGSSQFDWKDIKFYFNPNTFLLEPISKEIHVDLNYEDKINFWWIDSNYIKDHLASDTDFFLDLLYSDLKFYKEYLQELNKFSKDTYFENIIKENQKEFEEHKQIIKQSYPTKKIFSLEYLIKKRKIIQKTLNPIQGLNSYFDSFKSNVLTLNISNVQRLPIIISGIKLNDGSNIYLSEKIIINGKKPHKPAVNNLININCTLKKYCSKKQINKQQVIYKILGQDEFKLENISEHYFVSNKK
jgi:hypothetical protein|tara:strand:+ start:52 stop:1677 length:1626 start_codon:yes stop_codon:yes gene_type:complete